MRDTCHGNPAPELPPARLASQTQGSIYQLPGSSLLTKTSSFSVIHWLMKGRGRVAPEEEIRQLRNQRTLPKLHLPCQEVLYRRALLTPFKLFTSLTGRLLHTMQQLPRAAAQESGSSSSRSKAHDGNSCWYQTRAEAAQKTQVVRRWKLNIEEKE